MNGRPFSGAPRTGGQARLVAALLSILLLLVVAGCAGQPAADASSAGQPTTSPVAVAPPPSLEPAPEPSVATSTPVLTPTPTASARPDLVVVTLGDSIPYASYDCGNCDSSTTLVAEALAESTGQTVVGTNLSSHDGLRDERLLSRIQTFEPYREAIADADIVILYVGHNDTPWNAEDDDCDGPAFELDWSLYDGPCVDANVEQHADLLGQILDEIVALRAGAQTAIRVATQYNDWIGWFDAPPEAVEPSIRVIDAYYESTCEVAAAHGAECVDTYHAFNGPKGRRDAGELLALDHTHPSAEGQARIAEAILESGFAPLDLP